MLIPPRVSVPVVKHEQPKHSLDDLKKKKIRKKKKGRVKPLESDVDLFYFSPSFTVIALMTVKLGEKIN